MGALMSEYRVEVIADNSGEWCGNALRFDTADEARAYALDLSSRWMLVRASSVVDADGEGRVVVTDYRGDG
jgi:hypothetical protein